VSVRVTAAGTAFAALLLLSVPHARAQTASRLRPTPLKALNTPEGEDDPYLNVSKEGRVGRLYYVSKKSGQLALYVSELDRAGRWGKSRVVEGPSGAGSCRSPCLTPDGHDLYLATTFGNGSFDLGHSVNTDPDRADQFTEPAPLQATASPADELHPWITADGRSLYFSRKDPEGWRIYVASRPAASGAFEKVQRLDELPAGFHHATLTSDGMTMFLQGPLPGNRWGLFRCKRQRKPDRTWKPWSEPTPLIVLNAPMTEAPEGDTSPSLSRDDKWLLFASDRREGGGGRHLYQILAGTLIFSVWKETQPVPSRK
jgi:hypothetical protein